MRIFLHFIPNFCIKNHTKGILVISCSGTHFSPYVCLWILSTCLYKSLIKFCLKKTISALHSSQSESFYSLGAFWSFHIKILTERYFKIPHFGNLFVLVHFVVFFNCFTLRCFQNYFFLPTLFFLFCKSIQFYFLFAD